MKNRIGCKKEKRKTEEKKQKKEANAKRAFAHTCTLKTRKESDRHASSTRVINRLATHTYIHTHRCLTITTRINLLDDYPNWRRKKRKTSEWKRIRRSVTNRMCNEANSI